MMICKLLRFVLEYHVYYLMFVIFAGGKNLELN